MNNRRRKTKGLSRWLIAWLLCCVCLIGAMPISASIPHFTRENYTLLGWDENPDATTPTYQLGQGSITLDKDVTTLYAIWKLNTVNLTIQKTVSGNMYSDNDVFSFTLAYDGKSEKQI